MIHCKGLTKVYGKGSTAVKAVDHISLDIAEGSFVAIIGASGSGKSTLMHLLGGLDRADEGTVTIKETAFEGLSEEDMAVFRRRQIGIVYQFFNLIPTLTVRKNILLPLLLDGKHYESEHFHEIVKTLGLETRLDAMPHELSGGQQQRVAIARSLISRPAIVLADEPTGNLDRKNSEETIALFRHMNRKFNQTLVLITHDETIANQADRVIQMQDGQIVRDEVINVCAL